MINYFKGTFIGRLLLLILLYLALRLPLLLIGIPLTLPELKFMLIGERMASGFSMYQEIYDSTAPISAALFWIIDLLFGRSVLAYRLVALLLLLIQGVRFNAILVRNNLQGEKSYIPALLYLVAGSTFFELDTLSPLLIGHTFIIFSLRYFIAFTKEGFNNKKLFKAGFMLGLAALSFLPLTLYLIAGFFAIVLFASNAFRSFLLMLCGFLIPYAVATTYYLYSNSLSYFIDFNLLASWTLEFDFLLSPLDLMKIFAAPLLVLLLSVIKMPTVTLGLTTQQRFLQLMFVWLFTAILVAFISKEVSGTTFILFLPLLAYFGYFLFQRRSRKWISDVAFLLFLLVVAAFRYHDVLHLQTYTHINTAPLLVPKAHAYPQVEQQKIVVLGPDISFYKENRLATPYLNWQLSQQQFQDLEYYSSIFRIYRNFTKETPAFIIDQAGVVPILQEKLPGIFNNYKLVQAPSLYKLQNQQAE
ncbi:MAG: hypothetical protein LPJ89_03055 [Hymenobacteraceae bacterium]|nr:hypothetical protein [Hymenobacteraceae bacterium]MDX5396902.1 hypothetical protein [Hymenobacteraceae bacterium]MDX5442743.1 hypothetical protein [Hymenobacteraceae bacterium]MDX5512976.1 hypothetical protein [Hymenobacteraceae bacterium]